MLKILEETDGEVKSIEYNGQKISLGDILDFRESTIFYKRFALVDIIIKTKTALGLHLRVHSLEGRMVDLKPNDLENKSSFKVIAPDKAIEKLNDLYQLINKLDITIRDELTIF